MTTVQILNNIDVNDSLSSSNKNSIYDSPKITYIVEPSGSKFEDAKRVIALVYSYTKDTIRYGASIFRKIEKNDYCIKSQIRTTALERFNKCPVIFSINNLITNNEIIHSIRYKMYKFGVKSKYLKNELFIHQEIGTKTTTSKDSLISDNSDNTEDRLPRISYIFEPEKSTWNNARRIIAISYSYNNNTIIYGASIFRRSEPTENCIKSQIRDTAIERFYKSPIIIDILNTKENLCDEYKINNYYTHTVNTIIQTIRKSMHEYGVKNPIKKL